MPVEDLGLEWAAMRRRSASLRRGFGYLFAASLCWCFVSLLVLCNFANAPAVILFVGGCGSIVVLGLSIVLTLFSLGAFVGSLEKIQDAQDLHAACVLAFLTVASLFGAFMARSTATIFCYAAIACFVAYIVFQSHLLYRRAQQLGFPILSEVWFGATLLGGTVIALAALCDLFSLTQFTVQIGSFNVFEWAAGSYAVGLPPLSAYYFGRVWLRLADIQNGIQPPDDQNASTTLTSESIQPIER